MATVSKVNSEVIALATVYSHMQLKMFKIVPSVAFTADAGGNPNAIVEGTARAAAQELSPMMWEVKTAGADMLAVMDGHAVDIDSIAMRVGRVHTGSEGTVAAGVFTATVGGATVTVTEATTLHGL